MRINILVFFCFFYSFSQNIEKQADSLKQILLNKKLSVAEQIEVLDKLTLYYGAFDFEQASKLNNKIYFISKKNNYQKGFGHYFKNLANENIITGNFVVAEKYAFKSQKYFLVAKDTNNHISSVYETCFALDFQGKITESEQLALKTIRRYKNSPNAKKIADLYYYMSTLYNENRKAKTAFIYINKAAKIYRSTNNREGIFKCNYQLANIYYKNKMYAKSIDYLNKINHEMKDFINSNIENQLTINSFLAHIYLELKDYPKALSYAKTLKQLASKHKIIPQIKEANFYLSRIYAELNNKDLAEHHIKILDNQQNSEYETFLINTVKGILYFNQKNYKKSLYYRTLNFNYNSLDKENLNALSDTYYALKDYKQSHEYLSRYLKIEVADLNEEKNNQVIEFESLYRLKEKDFELKKNKFEKINQEFELQKQKQFIVLILSISLSLFLIIVFLIIIYLSNKKNNRLLKLKNEDLFNLNKQLEQANAEKTILLKEIHHRVKNNLQLVMSLLNIQAQDTQNISIQDFLEKGQSRIATMSLIHQNLYQTENFANINFQEYLEHLLANIKQTFNENNIDYVIKTNQNSFDLDTAIPLGLIINELVCNALKHAFPSNLKGRIEIEINKIIDNTYELKIGDNGVGVTSEKHNSNSIGLELVSLLVMQLKGKIQKLDTTGTNYKIIFNDSFSPIIN
jgi:two-component sensor histidine kinase